MAWLDKFKSVSSGYSRAISSMSSRVMARMMGISSGISAALSAIPPYPSFTLTQTIVTQMARTGPEPPPSYANPYRQKVFAQKKKNFLAKSFLKSFCWFRLVRYDKKRFLRCKKSFSWQTKTFCGPKRCLEEKLFGENFFLKRHKKFLCLHVLDAHCRGTWCLWTSCKHLE
jgi:hypothetical protein